MKPAWQTTEFWTSLIAQIVGILVLTGGIASTDADHIKTLGQEVVGGIIALVSLLQYVKSRTVLKQTVIDNMPPISISEPTAGAAPMLDIVHATEKTVHQRYSEALKQAGV